MKTHRGSKRLAMTSVLAVPVLILAACSSNAGSNSSAYINGSGKLTVGGLFPLTGAIAQYGTYWAEGAQVGIAAVNAAGGVMGHKLYLQLSDTEGDPVDAVSGLRALEVLKPDFILGPSGPDVLGPVALFDKYKTPDFFVGGVTALDKMNYPYVFRVGASDALSSLAMVAAAKDLGCTKAGAAFTADANAQDELTTIKKAFPSVGGQIVSSVTLAVPASSYLSEVGQLFSQPVQCIFAHMNSPADNTFFANARSLGHLNVPYIGDPTFADQKAATAMGLDAASKFMYGTLPVAASNAAYTEFAAQWAKAFPAIDLTSVQLASNIYDAVIMAALAMQDAHSIDPTVWIKDVTNVSNPPGTMVYTYAQGLALLKQGQKINYEGAAGSEDFNSHHNIFSTFNVTGFTASGADRTVQAISQQDLANLAASVLGS